ncbi:apolipoprotein C-I, isoform CRA_b, partial [Mus musculus]
GIGVVGSWWRAVVNTSDVPRYPCVCLQGAPPTRMRLFIALPVLIVVVAMTLEGPGSQRHLAK